MNLTISDVKAAAVQTCFAEWQSKGFIAVKNPFSEDGNCMLLTICAVMDYSDNKHVIIHVLFPLEIIWKSLWL